MARGFISLELTNAEIEDIIGALKFADSASEGPDSYAVLIDEIMHQKGE